MSMKYYTHSSALRCSRKIMICNDDDNNNACFSKRLLAIALAILCWWVGGRVFANKSRSRFHDCTAQEDTGGDKVLELY